MTQRTLRFTKDGILEIKTPREVRTYWVRETGVEFGIPAEVERTFEVEKMVGESTIDRPKYNVTVRTADKRSWCNCPAGKWGKPCVHKDALVKLVEIGRV